VVQADLAQLELVARSNNSRMELIHVNLVFLLMDIVKRKMPEGGLLTRDILLKGSDINIEEDFQWKEWSILILYHLCEIEQISHNDKKYWGKMILDGKSEAFVALKSYAQTGDINELRKSFDKATY
jgi:hypothetical protein